MEDILMYRDNIRIITFQSKEVVDNLLKNGYYEADPLKCREKNNYIRDINQLNGSFPIWGFTIQIPVNFKDLYDGRTFNNFSAEMSNDSNQFSPYLMLELIVPKGLVKQGLTRSYSRDAKVFPHINISMVVGIYKPHTCYVYRELGTRIVKSNSTVLERLSSYERVNNVNSMFSETFSTLTYEEFKSLTGNVEISSFPLTDYSMSARHSMYFDITMNRDGSTTTDETELCIFEPKFKLELSTKISTNPLD